MCSNHLFIHYQYLVAGLNVAYLASEICGCVSADCVASCWLFTAGLASIGCPSRPLNGHRGSASWLCSLLCRLQYVINVNETRRGVGASS